MIRKLISAWTLALVGSLLLPLMSLAAVSGTTCDLMPSTTTTEYATMAEHTVAIETVSGGETGLRIMAGGQAQSLLCLSGRFLAAKTTIPSSGGVIRQFEQAADQTYYRVFSGDATAGKWLTAVPPRSSAFAQEGLALPPWNAANMIQEVRVPAGTMLERSRAIPVPEWGRLRGGAEQFQLLDEIPLNSFGPGVPLR